MANVCRTPQKLLSVVLPAGFEAMGKSRVFSDELAAMFVDAQYVDTTRSAGGPSYDKIRKVERSGSSLHD
jgi:hypothetical protein